MSTLAIPDLEADCAERDPGDEHHTAGNQGMARSHKPLPAGSSPAPATNIDAVQARVSATYSGDKVMLFFTDNSGHRSVVMLSHTAAAPLIDDLIASQACAEAHAQLRAVKACAALPKASS